VAHSSISERKYISQGGQYYKILYLMGIKTCEPNDGDDNRKTEIKKNYNNNDNNSDNSPYNNLYCFMIIKINIIITFTIL